MQHTALDSISISRKLTGTPFPAVSHSSDTFNQHKVNIAPRSPFDQGCGVFKKYFRVAINYRCRQTVANELCSRASNAFSWIAEMAAIPNKKFNLIPRRRLSNDWRHERNLPGIGEKLWLMLEVRRGLGVQVQ